MKMIKDEKLIYIPLYRDSPGGGEVLGYISDGDVRRPFMGLK